MAKHNETGKWGEELATQYLKKKGYIIIERDWHSGKRDIDIIAKTADLSTIVFVEVKTRTSAEVTLPEDAVTRKKIFYLGQSANNYVKMRNIEEELRFDIVSIVGTSNENAVIEHIEDAFNPLLA
jgi:putative endonuclease